MMPICVHALTRYTSAPARRRFSLWLRRLPYVVLLAAAPASAQLMVHPTRIVLDQAQHAAQLEVINNSTEPATYRLSLVNRRMTEDGRFVPVETPAAGERFAQDMLRYSPRHVTLAPGTSQVVRLLLRKPAGLAAGEYRSHLLFVKQADTALAAKPGAPAGDGIEIGLNALVGVSVPVIVREGETSASVTITGLALSNDDRSALASLQLNRTGTRSVYGDLIASFTPKGGAPRIVGRAGGVAVYTPNPSRRVQLRLDAVPGLRLASGTLTVSYREQGGGVLAESSLAVR